MNKIDPKSLNIVQDLPPQMSTDDKLSVDTEWFGMDGTKLHRPSGKFASLSCSPDGRTVYVITDSDLVQEFWHKISPATLLFANAKFDIFHLRRLIHIPVFNKIWDVLLIDQIRHSGLYDTFTLKDLARRELDVYMEKESRETFETSTEMSQEQLEYTAIDTVATWRVYQAQRQTIDQNDLNVWKNIDRGALWVVLSMMGMKVDTSAWNEFAEDNEKRALEIQTKYPEMNLNSHPQVKKYLINLGYDVENTREDTISPYQDECEFIKELLEYRGLTKFASTYGKDFITDNVERDGRVYSDFRIIGAATGRLSSSKPNVENIPVRDTDKLRSAFVADDGNVLVDADFSAQEPRVSAFVTQDEKMIDIFKSGKDVYIEAARLMFGWELTKNSPERKKRMKPTVLGSVYGLTEYGMEKKYGIPKDEGKELLNTFFDVFVQTKKWIDRQQKARNYVTTVWGRKFWINSYLGYHADNNKINSPIQGSGADILKVAAFRFMNEWGWDNPAIINLSHDEIVLEVKKELVDKATDILERSMRTAAEDCHKGIPSEIEIRVDKNWALAHA